MTDTTERPGGTTEPPRPPTGRPGAVSHVGIRLAGLLAVLVLVGVTNPWMLLVIFAIVVMIFLHELGHYVMAKRAGMKVTEFFLGFGPKLWSTRRGETEYGIKLIPAGAYVKIIGMHNLDEVAPEDEGRTYRQKTFGQRLGVAVAGSTMHFLLALGLIFVSLVAVGAPGGTINPQSQEHHWLVGDVVKGSGAADAGLRSGDRIISINGSRVDTFTDMGLIVRPLKGKTVAVVYERDGKQHTTQSQLREFQDDRQPGVVSCCLGIGRQSFPRERLNPLEGLAQTPRQFGDIASMSLSGLGRFFSPSGLSGFASQVGSASKDKATITRDRQNNVPLTSSKRAAEQAKGNSRIVSIVGVVQIGSAVSPAALLNLFVLVNISIGIINLIPLLPFDGGHVMVAVYERIQERRLRRRRYFTDIGRLMPLTYAVVLLLGMLFVTSIYLDLVNPLVPG
ncbi:MAG: peptidase [Acidimicrobiales bacterium]|nr:peptidase [Acidimicrobiales bacterium]